MSDLDQRIQGDEGDGETDPQPSPDLTAEASASPDEPEKIKRAWRFWITAWASVLVWMVMLWAMIPIYLQLHGISLWRVSLSGLGYELDLAQLAKFSDFNFVGYPFPGNEPTAASMWVEIIFWSYVGIAASQVYFLSRLIIQKKEEYEAGFYMIRTFGIIIRAVALSTAIIFLLRIVTISIGPVTIDLRQADVQTVIAISFVVSFYNEDTERALRRMWKRASQTIGAGPDSAEEVAT